MSRPGPRPGHRAPKSIHIAFNEEERAVLTLMGTGDVKSKIRALIEQERERQRPKSKAECIARWTKNKKEAFRLSAISNAQMRELVEMGCNEEELNDTLIGEDQE